MRNKTALPQLALFAAAIIWGSSFVVMKDTVDIFSTNTILALRFGTGALLLALVFMKRLRAINIDYIKKGAVVGIFTYLGYVFQTYGLMSTTPGKNAFLTAIYCVLVPFLSWLLYKKKPDKYNIIAAFVCLVGVGLISLKGNLTIGIGDLLTLIGGVLFTFQVVTLSEGSQGKDIIPFSVIVFATAFIPSLIMALLFEQFPAVIPTGTYWGMAFLIIFPTCVSLCLQAYGQRGTPATMASLILCLESVFGAITSLIVGQEKMSLRLGAGFIVIFVAVVISETKLSFLKKKKPALNSEEAGTERQ